MFSNMLMSLPQIANSVCSQMRASLASDQWQCPTGFVCHMAPMAICRLLQQLWAGPDGIKSEQVQMCAPDAARTQTHWLLSKSPNTVRLVSGHAKGASAARHANGLTKLLTQ